MNLLRCDELLGCEEHYESETTPYIYVNMYWFLTISAFLSWWTNYTFGLFVRMTDSPAKRT